MIFKLKSITGPPPPPHPKPFTMSFYFLDILIFDICNIYMCECVSSYQTYMFKNKIKNKVEVWKKASS